jgi:ankyrin repeat protein
MKAAEAGEYEICKYLMDEKCFVDAKDDEHWTCLMWAALSGQVEICEMFVRGNYLTTL